MFYSQVILAKKGPLAKVWLAAHWGDKKLARPQIFATDIAQSVDTIVNPTMPLALRMSGHLLLGVVRIYSRKVKYVLNDCTEAMLKLQMAFHPNGGGGGAGGKELLETGAAGSHHNATVTNFGDYDQVHVVEGFCLPLPDNNEWILAEDDDEEEEGGRGEGVLSLPVSMTTATQQSSPEQRYQPPQEETWVPFDPENEDDEDDEMNNPNGSLVSDVELARAAGDSFLSGDETRRASSIMDKSQDAPLLRGPHQEEEEEEDFAHVPFDEEEEEEEQPAAGGAGNDDSLLRLSHGGGADISGLDTSGLSGGLDESREEQGATNKRAADDEQIPKRKRRKRRKVVIDNDSTELSNEHIRAMLGDTSDIVKRQVHPADLLDEEDGAEESTAAAVFVPILTQPFLADDGNLHPELAALWRDNFYRALDQPCPFEKVQDEGDVEQVRQAPQEPNDEEASRSDMEDDGPKPTKDGQQMEEEEEPDDFPPPQLDDEEEEEEENMAIPMDSDEEENVARHHQADGGDGIGDLGLVNELQIDSDEEEDDEENREAVGEHAGTKWHKHTVKVLKLLQGRMRPAGMEGFEDEADEEKPTSLEFGELAKNVNRRTAASCFMECLQLKTWDFVELAQDDEYGPINISAGPRFQEAPPNEA